MIDPSRWGINVVKRMFDKSASKNVEHYFGMVDDALQDKIEKTLKNRATFSAPLPTPAPLLATAVARVDPQRIDSIRLKLYAFATIAAENAPFGCSEEKPYRLNTRAPLVFASLPARMLPVAGRVATMPDSPALTLPVLGSRPNSGREGLLSKPHPFDRYDYKNGNKGYGEGERYRGRGFIQLTGRANYVAYGEDAGLPNLVMDPDLASKPKNAALIAASYILLNQNDILTALHERDFAAARAVVNGGSNGLDTFRDAYIDGEQALSPVIFDSASNRAMNLA